MLRGRILLCAGALCVALPASVFAQRQAVDPIPIGNIVEKLGSKVMPSSPRELELGHSATTTLAEPAKITAYGIKGMHEGARVTITCVGPNRLRVEVDEMEPVAKSATVTLKIAEDGSMTQVAEHPQQPQQPKPPAP